MSDKLKAAFEKLSKKGITLGTYIRNGAISTGLAGVDRFFEGSGIPRGQITVVLAEQNMGKSTFALGVAAALHADVVAGREKRGRVLFIDTEKTFRESYARSIGVHVDDPEMWLYADPDDGMDAIEMMEALVDSGEIDLIILDSITFMVPRALLEADPDKNLPAVQARQNSHLVLRLVGRLSRHQTALLIINHNATEFGKTDFHGNAILKDRGGDMLKNATSVKFWLKKAGKPLGVDGKPVADLNDSAAAAVNIRIDKNKTGRQQVQIPARMVYGAGFDRIYDLFQIALQLGIYSKGGSWVYLLGNKDANEGRWQGEQAAIDELSEDAGLFERVRALVRERGMASNEEVAEREAEREAEEAELAAQAKAKGPRPAPRPAARGA